jgi:hypothetical protein
VGVVGVEASKLSALKLDMAAGAAVQAFLTLRSLHHNSTPLKITQSPHRSAAETGLQPTPVPAKSVLEEITPHLPSATVRPR